MQLVTNAQQLDIALKEQSACIIMQYTNKIVQLMKENHIFTNDGTDAFIAQKAGPTIEAISLLPYCKGENTGREMDDSSIAAFVKAGGRILH